MDSVLLSTLLKDICKVSAADDKKISGLSLDSRQVGMGDLFFAIPGVKGDGRKYTQDAISKGAVAIVAEIRYEDAKKSAVPIFFVSELKNKLGVIAARYFSEPAKKLRLMGVTGTNGKTSCSHFIAACLEAAGQRTGLIGTLGSGFYGHLGLPDLTTPNPIVLQRTLAQMLAAGAKNVVMEVSSHGLEQGRIKGLPFTIAIFTNLTRDHLDYHGTMENYANAKRKLFLQPDLKYAVINIDDEFGRQLVQEFRDRLQVYTYSASGRILDPGLPQIRAQQVNLDFPGMTASVHTPWGDVVLRSRLLGRFNLSNLLAVLTTLCILDIPIESALAYLADLQCVPGRMEIHGGGQQPVVVIDYAHSPDPLQQILETMREYCTGELWCVFGCGGDRDKGKRPMMGAIAENYADRVVVTDDNPRTEEPAAIVAEILQGMRHPEAVVVEHDRHRAITHAIQCAHPGDVVVIAGKGCETYQVIGQEKRPFNDAVTAQMVLTELAS